MINGEFIGLWGKGSRGMRNATLNSGAIDFLVKFTGSENFEKTFKEGMGLVEETANYLDSEGRVDARVLDRTGAIAYATESMRLTTRLMQMASWLLLQRAIAAGELNASDMQREKHRINLGEIGRGHTLKGAETLPDGLVALVERSLRLLERIKTLDSMISATKAETLEVVTSPISQQMNMLKRAFKAG
jgi:regulator of CtrA degradation